MASVVSDNWVDLITPGIKQLVEQCGGTGCNVQRDTNCMYANITVMNNDCINGFTISREMIEDDQYEAIHQMVRQACGATSWEKEEGNPDNFQDIIDQEVGRLNNGC